MKISRYIISLAAAIVSLGIFASCGKDEPTPPPTPPAPEETTGTTVLIYTVANNSLYNNFNADMDEILEGAKDIDLTTDNVLVYSFLSPYEQFETSEAKIEKLVQTPEGTYAFETVKTYDKDKINTDPERFKQVVEDAYALYPSERKGLIFWGHGTAWSPNFDRDRAAYSFGGEQDRYWLDLDEIADCLPDRQLDFIWFDCCLMSNIETLYQLRNKADFIAGCPMEIAAPGMPYDLTLPLLCKLKITEAADVLFDYYNDANIAVSTTVIDTSYLPKLAEVTRELYQDFKPLSSIASLQKYSRKAFSPVELVDLSQYSDYATSGRENDDKLLEFQQVLDDMVIQVAISALDFNRRPIKKEVCCGISAHSYGMSANDQHKEAYYETLDWPRAVYNLGNE